MILVSWERLRKKTWCLKLRQISTMWYLIASNRVQIDIWKIVRLGSSFKISLKVILSDKEINFKVNLQQKRSWCKIIFWRRTTSLRLNHLKIYQMSISVHQVNSKQVKWEQSPRNLHRILQLQDIFAACMIFSQIQLQSRQRIRSSKQMKKKMTLMV